MKLTERVWETSTTTGTGALTLAGAATGYRQFSDAYSDGQQMFYFAVMQDGSEWESGIGVWNSGGDTLTRLKVIESSNSNALVNFSAGTKDVFVGLPASRTLRRGQVVANGTNW